ncbi:YdcF family protein [Pseudothauera nasutitermitis]|uniref:YdcF family protein n=1 Tax=Pseudothauera nasutitermitis TaxID=2565930 RepID=A0A4S4ASR7_9RHOO|nr:YdcF family protein [Pseudothauera nasutitermitis]THF62935.1 YdcF family protein [Pseudothauera nasutitermitis]
MSLDFALLLFWSKKLLATLLLPPIGPLLLIAAGLLLTARRPRAGRVLAWSGLAIAVLLTLPAGSALLLGGLEARAPIGAAELERAEAIVVLGGGRRDNAPDFGGETINRLTLERVRYGARLARQSGLPVLVSGGAPGGGIPEATLMRQALEEEFGVPVRWAERASLDTRQNAQFSAVLLHAAGVRRIALVTHAAHLPRARAEFEAAGLEVIDAPTAWLGFPGGTPRALDLLPGAGAAYASWMATHEWLGRLAYRLSR